MSLRMLTQNNDTTFNHFAFALQHMHFRMVFVLEVEPEMKVTLALPSWRFNSTHSPLPPYTYLVHPKP